MFISLFFISFSITNFCNTGNWRTAAPAYFPFKAFAEQPDQIYCDTGQFLRWIWWLSGSLRCYYARGNDDWL